MSGGKGQQRASGASRRMHRGSARSTLLNALGELVHPGNQPAPTAALLAVMSESGYEHFAARQAITRCARVGWISGARRGRESWWSLTGEGQRLIEDGIRRVEALGRAPDPWDGRWLVVLTSVPNDIRSVRQRLYRSLSWAGFGCPAPGVWLSPYPHRLTSAKRVIERLDLSSHTMAFVGPAADIGITDSDIVARAWALDEVDELYTGLVERFDRCRPATELDALRMLLALDQELQRLPMIDPQLPGELAPDQRSRRAAARLLELRATWMPSARAFWRSIERGTNGAADPGAHHEVKMKGERASTERRRGRSGTSPESTHQDETSRVAQARLK